MATGNQRLPATRYLAGVSRAPWEWLQVSDTDSRSG